MAQITLNEPVVGQLDSSEEPKIPSNFVVLQTLVNGNLDTTNLSPTAGITKGQLAAGAGSLGARNVTANTTAANGDLIIVTSGTPPVLVALPSPTIHSIVGIVAFGATTVVATPSGVILGVGLNAASVTLATPGSFVILEANGSNWHVIGGQQDTGWTALTLAAGITQPVSTSYAPACRLVADRVEFRGAFLNNSGGIVTVPASIGSGFSPAHFVQMSASIVFGGPYAVALQIAASGTGITFVYSPDGGTTSSGMPLNSVLHLDGLFYSLS